METTEKATEPMMKAEPQAEHRWLERLVGDWIFEVEATMAPGQPPQKSTGTESVRALGNLWFVAEGQGEMPGCGHAATIMTLGYDTQKQRYVGTWVGSMMTCLWVYEGERNPSEDALTLEAEGPDFSGTGKMATYRDVIAWDGDDRRTLTSYAQNENGEWQPFMTARYHRTGAQETITAPADPAFVPARFEDRGALILAGLVQRYTYDTMGEIPAQWGRFAPHIGSVPNRTGPVTYGLVMKTDAEQSFDYMTAVEVADPAGLPAELATLSVPAQRYAVFPHEGALDTLCETIDAAFHRWLPASGHTLTGTPDCIERYGEAFDLDVAAATSRSGCRSDSDEKVTERGKP